MNAKCPDCRLVNFPAALKCARCGTALGANDQQAVDNPTLASTIFRRAIVCIMVLLIVIAGFYLSLIGSASSLSHDEKKVTERAIGVLREKGFNEEVFLLVNLAAYRSTDNWLNASVEKENAYAATNFPFEILTIYPVFFTDTVDDTERAAILLHEAKHLAGMNEHDAYEYVWKHREQLGWTADKYSSSQVWQGVRRQTKDNVPLLFVCDFNEGGDCVD